MKVTVSEKDVKEEQRSLHSFGRNEKEKVIYLLQNGWDIPDHQMILLQAPKKEKPFPKLMINKVVPETIFLAIEKYGEKITATVIKAPNLGHYIGFYDEEWTAENFEDFHGTVTLENK